jgi:uncharacterized membrane protein YphA (DoxX/SURF4 family)
VLRTATLAAAPLARSGARKQQSEGWWGLRPRIGRGRGERVLLPEARRSRRHEPGPFERLGPVAVRLGVAAILIVFAWNKVLDDGRLAQYSERLATGDIPPLTIAAVMVYVQLVAGIGLAIGLLSRPMALLAAIHSVAALILVQGAGVLHSWIIPCTTLAGALYIMLKGPGPFSLDGLRGRT